MAEVLTILGKIYLYRSDFEAAQNSLTEAIRLGTESNTMPQVYEARVELADCLLNLGEYDESARLARSVLEQAQALGAIQQRAEQVIAEALN